MKDDECSNISSIKLWSLKRLKYGATFFISHSGYSQEDKAFAYVFYGGENTKDLSNIHKEFYGKTEIEAVKKAKEWIIEVDSI